MKDEWIHVLIIIVGILMMFMCPAIANLYYERDMTDQEKCKLHYNYRPLKNIPGYCLKYFND